MIFENLDGVCAFSHGFYDKNLSSFFFQLYEIDDNPKRKEFLDELFAFMQKRGTPINRLPIMAKQVLDLYELYNLVVARGGLVEVINKKQWQEIIKGLGLPSSITSAAFTLRTQYTKYLYPLEMNQHNFSTGGDLQNAIDGNKREGRRLGPYDTPVVSSQSSPLSSHSHLQQQYHHHQQYQQQHHRLSHSPPASQASPPPPQPHHLAAHMNSAAHHHHLQAAAAAAAAAASGHHPDALAQLEMTRLALWKLYSQGQQVAGGGGPPVPPPHLLPLPPLDLDQLSSRRREQQERLLEEQQQQQLRKEEERRRRGDEARRRLLEAETQERLVAAQSPAEKRSRGRLQEEEEGEQEEHPMEEQEEEESKRRRIHEEEEVGEEEEERPSFSVELSGKGTEEPEGKSMKISMEVNGIVYSGILYAKPS